MKKVDRVMEPSEDYQAFLKMDLSKAKPEEYVVLVDGKMFGKGKNLVRIVNRARKMFPKQVPFVAKIPPKGLLVY